MIYYVFFCIMLYTLCINYYNLIAYNKLVNDIKNNNKLFNKYFKITMRINYNINTHYTPY